MLGQYADEAFYTAKHHIHERAPGGCGGRLRLTYIPALETLRQLEIAEWFHTTGAAKAIRRVEVQLRVVEAVALIDLQYS